MNKIKIKRTVFALMAMEKVFQRLLMKGTVSFMIAVSKNYNAIGAELKEYRLENLTSDEYKACQKQLRMIQSNILGDKQSFDKDMKKRFEKAADEFWLTGRNPTIKQKTEEVKKDWEKLIKETEVEIELMPFKIEEIPKDFLDEKNNKELAAVFVQLCEEIVI